MTKLLGIDYGQKKIGLAIGDDQSRLAEPLLVVRVGSLEEALEKVAKVVEIEKVEKMVIGVSEGVTAEKTRIFGEQLLEKAGCEVVYQDETLTTYHAQTLSLQANLKQKKRKDREDAYAAALIVQAYLDEL